LNIDGGTGVLSVTGGVNTGNYSFSGNDLTLPNNARLNGGHFLTNSPEFGTTATINVMQVMHSEIYMGAGTAESRAIVDDQGRGLMYLGVENVGAGKYAGIVARDPNVEGEYSPGIQENGLPMIGVGGDSYAVTVGVLNGNTNLDGFYADETQVIVSNDTNAWNFHSDGNLALPSGGGITFSNGTLNTVGGGLTARAYNGNFVVRVDETQNVPRYPPTDWTFGVDGDLTVPGQIRNTQGYRAVWNNEVPQDISDLTDNSMLLGASGSTMDINIDGGGAYATYEGTLVRADGGFSGTRWGVNTTIFDGGLGAAGTGYTTTLNGGGA
jgi:hypothetical protein